MVPFQASKAPESSAHPDQLLTLMHIRTRLSKIIQIRADPDSLENVQYFNCNIFANESNMSFKKYIKENMLLTFYNEQNFYIF